MIHTDHQKQWKFLKNKFASNQLSHAYLFSGPEGIGKTAFAKEFVRFINCLKPDVEQNGCGKCLNCILLSKNSFPDLMMVTSADSKSSVEHSIDKMEIDVAQIRGAQNFLSYKSYYGNYKAVIVDHAERMNPEAQNCFLKNLEEPKGKTLIILVSSKPGTLLPTVVSRCQQLTFFGKKDYTKEDAKILDVALKVLQGDLAQKFAYAKAADLTGNNLGNMLTALQRHFRNLLLAKLGIENAPRAGLGGLEISHSVETLKKNLRFIEKLYAQVSTTNASPKLALEMLLLEL